MIFLSPGVKSEEIDLSGYVGQQSSCIVGMVGGGSKGKVGIPTLVTSPTDLVNQFGSTLLDDYGILNALEYLKQGNILYYCRGAEDSAAASSVELLGGLITIEAKDMGLDGDKISVELTSATGDTAVLFVSYNGSQKERFDISLDPDSSDYISNIKSEYIIADFNNPDLPELSITEFVNSFTRVAENVYILTSSSEIKNMGSLKFAVDGSAVVNSVKVKKDSYGLFNPGDVVGQGQVVGGVVDLVFSEGAKVKVPDGRISDFKVSLQTNTTITDEESFNANMPEEYATQYPWTGPECAPAAGNPWLITEFTVDQPNMDVNFVVYCKSDISQVYPVEIVTSSQHASHRTFKSAGKKYMMFEVYKSREGCDTLNFVPRNGNAGDYICRIEVLEDGVPVQRFEEEFTITNDDVAASFTVADPQVIAPELNAPTDESTSDGLRSLTVEAALLDAYGQLFSWDVTLKPSDETITPFVPGESTTPSLKPSLTNVPDTKLTGGNNGTPLQASTVVKELRKFIDADTLDINLLAAPGHYEDIVVSELITIAENRADCVAIIDPPFGLSRNQVIDWHNGRLEGDGYLKKALNSSYAAVYWPWVQINDVYTGETLWSPPSGVVLGAFAYNDAKGQPWFATAGLNRGMLNSVVGLEKALDDGDRDALYGLGNVINPIVNYKQQGYTIWGQRTTQRKSSALDRINVRRLVNLIRKTVAASTAYLIFDDISDLTYRKWKGIVNPVLETIKTSRGLYDYKTVMDDTTVTEAHKDRNEMPGQVWLKPTKTAEFIPISFIITNSGSSFDEM